MLRRASRVNVDSELVHKFLHWLKASRALAYPLTQVPNDGSVRIHQATANPLAYSIQRGCTFQPAVVWCSSLRFTVRLKLEFYWIPESIGGGSANRNSASRGYIGEAVELFLEFGRRTSSSTPSAPCRIALTNKREPRLTNSFLINHSIYYRC